jgi:two-component system, sensor histidine kinase
MTEAITSQEVAAVENGDGPPEQYASLVFLVDDQPIVGEAVRRLLAGEQDMNLHYCSQPAEALEIADSIKPTVILQDLVLPDTDGLEMVRRFRANPSTENTPIIVLSVKEDALVKSAAFAHGANDYLVKLPDRAELVARIRYHTRAYLAQIQRDAAFRALRESQQQLLESNTMLLGLNQQLNEFLGMAAHDLRNPLAAMQGFSKLLLAAAPGRFSPEQQRQLLERIQSSSDFMLRLVNDLLDISKIESGKLTLDLQPVNLREIVQSTVEVNRIFASDKKITINFEPDSEAHRVWIDAHKMEQVVTNLLTNAIKYSHPNTTITITLRQDADVVVLSVTDQGVGIAPDELHKLFTPFGVTSVKATAGEKSTGLGLVIVKKIVEGHQGSLGVDSTVGVGSTFSVILPTSKPLVL